MSAEQRSADEARHARLKAAILNGWQRLSPDEQATVIVEQLRTMFQAEGGAALDKALRSSDIESDALNAVFPITGVSRADLQKRLRYSESDIQSLEDHHMREIAGKLEDAYVENDFWHHVRIVTDEVLARKRRLSAKNE